MKFRPF